MFKLRNPFFSSLLTILVVIQSTAALRSFRQGRHKHGFLGDPDKAAVLLEQGAEPKDLWFRQPLDHFNKRNKATWLQRYFVNDEHYRDDGHSPIFLMIGGEAEASKMWMRQGAWIHYAEHFNALCFQVEHRYYGKSRPTDDLSTKNLEYLTSEQALADLASFIVSMREQYNLTHSQKWIVFGGSYPGSLAAWMREKYPNLVHGAISSSGPLLAKVDFIEYYEVVKASLASYSVSCLDAVTRSFSQVEILLKHMIGQRNLDKIFKTCTPIKDSIDNYLDISNFFESLASNFAGVVQYNKDNSPHATITIDEVCNVMLNTSLGAPATRLAAVNDLLLKASNETCLDYKYDKMIQELREISWDSEAATGMRQWTFQTCNEFGFYQTSENKSETFGDRFQVDFFIRQCMDIFSDSMDAKYLKKAVEQTNIYYGALRPNTTNVIYVHGSIDPWHALGLTSKTIGSMVTLYIEGTAHCANMYEPSKDDLPQLVAARHRILKFLAKLLDSYVM